MAKPLLLLYILLVVGLTFVLPSLRVYRKTGIDPFVFDRSDSAHDLIGRLFKLVFGSLVAAGAVRAFGPETWQDRLGALPLPAWAEPLGAVLLFAALVWIGAAQIQMGDWWRIGIDEKNETELVDRGLFARSRNPIFLGMQATLVGFFLVMPSIVSLLALAIGAVLAHIQVRLEEEFLRKTHGERYQAYCRRVRRWL